MRLNKSFMLFLCLCLLLLMGACNNNSTPSEPVNQTPNTYYDEANFMSSNKEVKTTKLVTYDGPSYLNDSEKVDITVNGNALFVYETRVNHGRKFTWDGDYEYAPVAIFDFEGKVQVEITVTSGEEVKSATVSPLVYGISPTITNNKIIFELEYNDNYVIEYNGDSNTAIHLFANPIEEKPITSEDAENDESIIYIGPGVYKADALPVASNTTVYLAGGAYVYGQIRTEGLENVIIRGRGIISGAIYNRRSESEYTIPVEIRSSKNVKIEGITILDPAGWTVALYKSSDIILDNVKIITARQNGDGISVQSCKDVTIKGGFVRSWDDSLVVKNTDRGTTENITFDGVNVWTDLAQSMEVGYETNGATMNDITFKNITVIHNFHKAVISLHNCDDAHITNVTYSNITVEDGQMLGDVREDGENDFLIDFTIAYNVDWTQSGGIRGSVDGITIENVKVYKMLDGIVGRMNGESAESAIKNVEINGLEIAGKKINSAEKLGLLTNAYTENISFNNLDKVVGAMKNLPYKLALETEEISHTNFDNIEQEGMVVPEFAVSKGDMPYIGVATNVIDTVTATHSKGNKPTTSSDDGSGDFSATNHAATNASDGNLETTWKNKKWTGEDEEFAALTFDFGEELKTIGVLRIVGNQNNKAYYTYSLQVWVRKVKSDGTVNDKYTRLTSLKDYQMSPGSNNCIDINITSQEYAGIQLRLYRSESVTAPKEYEISEVLFYAPSLTFGKAIKYSTEHNDVYPVEKIIDGDATGTSYYESKGFPAEIVIDLGDLHDVSVFVLCLPPSLMWDARTQEIEILGSDSQNAYDSQTKFTTIVAKTGYLFDPAKGNRIMITLDSSVNVRYIKLVISSNDIIGGYGAQLSEFSVYGD